MSYGTLKRQVVNTVGAGERTVTLVSKAAIRGVITRLGGNPANALLTAGHFKNTGEPCVTTHVRIAPGKINRVTGVGPYEKLVKAAATEGQLVEFIGDAMNSTRMVTGQNGKRFPVRTGAFGLKAEEAYVWNLEKNEKVNVATGDVIPVLPEIVAQAKAELGL